MGRKALPARLHYAAALYCLKEQLQQFTFLMMNNIFRRFIIDRIATPEFAITCRCAHKAACIITTLCCLLFCPWVAAKQIVQLQQQVVTIDNIYHQYTAELWTGLVCVLLVILLAVHLMRTKAKLAYSLGQARQITQQLKQSTDKLAYMVATSPTVLFAMRIKGNSLIAYWVSDNLTRITGYTVEEALCPLWWVQHLYVDDRTRILNESKVLFSGKHLTYEYRFIHKNGSIIWIRDNQQLICDKNGQPQVMFMDLDRFKMLKDTQCHDMGDKLLIEVAQRLHDCIRGGDMVARLGGDEFVVMLENLSEIQTEAAIHAQTVAEKIRDALESAETRLGIAREIYSAGRRIRFNSVDRKLGAATRLYNTCPLGKATRNKPIKISGECERSPNSAR